MIDEKRLRSSAATPVQDVRDMLAQMIEAHDGSHAESCDSFGHGSDEEQLANGEEDERDYCDCGGLRLRQEARALLAADCAGDPGQVHEDAIDNRTEAALAAETDNKDESKWPCFWCGSMQAHETGWPGGMSTVPACDAHAAEHTMAKAMARLRTSEVQATTHDSMNEVKGDPR